MGGGGDQKKANAEQSRINAENQRQMQLQSLENEKKTRGYEYRTKKQDSLMSARRAAEKGISDERTKGIADSSALLENYKKQERARFMKSKTGRGQVTAEDNAISADDYKNAQSLLNKGSDYWDAKRTVAGDEAYAGAEESFLNETGTEEAYIAQGELAQSADLWDQKTTSHRPFGRRQTSHQSAAGMTAQQIGSKRKPGFVGFSGLMDKRG